MSSCISGGGGRTYRIDIDIVKSPSTSTRTSHSTSPSSTLSESSNSPLAISTRKPRTPRKRPNQTYNEAAALLSTVYPNIFSTKNLKNLSKTTKVFDSFVEEFSELLPPSPTFNAEFLLQPPIPSNPIFRIGPKRSNSLDKACLSPNYDSQSISSCPVSPALNGEFAPHPTIQDKSMVQLESKPRNSCEKICQSSCYDSQLSSWSPCDTYQEDFDADSILDEEIEEGIDSIMGNLSMENDSHEEANSSCFINQTSPYHWNPMGLGFGGKLDFGFGMGGGRGRVRALRHVDDGDWWRYPTVDILDISPKLKKTPREKKKKKVERVQELKKEESSSKEASNSNSVPTPKPNSGLNSALGLKLNHEEVLNAWLDRGSPFSDDIAGAEPIESDAITRWAQIDLFSENGGLREASVLRYREKRRSRLFSKKIRYEVRKVNADRRPRMKGRFVRRPPPTQNGQETKRK